MPKNDTLALASALIQRASVTPDDAECQPLMQGRLRQIGFEVTDLPFGEVSNFWAVRGGEGPLLVFAGHTDVVPTGPEQQWRYPPFDAAIADGMLHGRGAADMKGSLAAMLTACERYIARCPDHQGRIGFLITSDEEGPAIDGTVRVMEFLRAQQIAIDWCVVGEPSSRDRLGDIIKNGRRGSLNATLRVAGQQGHVAYPQLADNPIHRAMPALSELVDTRWDQGNDHFPATSLQISNIGGGTGATNVIPGELTIQFNFRYSTEVTADHLKQRVTDILRRHDLSYDIDWTLSGEPFLTAEGQLIAATSDAIHSICGYRAELSTDGGTSDGRFIAPTGAQVVELGPRNATIHQVDECVSTHDIEQLSAIYEGILERLLPDSAPA